MSRGVMIYFGVLAVLTLGTVVESSTIVGILLHILLGPILSVPPTLLYYSTALLPAYFISRLFHRNFLARALALVCFTLAAALPHYIGEYSLYRLVAADHTDPSALTSPRSFLLPFPDDYAYWSNNARFNERSPNHPTPPCADLCQQLLFINNVDQILVRSYLDPIADGIQNGTIGVKPGRAYTLGPNGSVRQLRPVAGAPNAKEFFKTKWHRFRLERRETCQETLTLIEAALARDAIGGRCLVEDAVDSPDADVDLSIVDAGRHAEPGRDTEAIGIQTGPTTVTITERRGDRSVPVEVKTTLAANYPTLPFHFTARQCDSNFYCLAIATDPFPKSTADPFEMIRSRYGLTIAETAWRDRFTIAVTDDDRAAVTAILDRDYSANAYIPMTPSMLVASFINARLKSGPLDQDDLDLIRALFRQRGFVLSIEFNRLRPATYQALKPLLPEIFNRIAISPNDEGFTRSLNDLLSNFSAQEIAPYLSTLCAKNGNVPKLTCLRFQSTRK
jgi:hypothetical protein